MSDLQESLELHAQRRRNFLKKSATVAIAAPAITLLLEAGAKPAFAAGYGGGVTNTTTFPFTTAP